MCEEQKSGQLMKSQHESQVELNEEDAQDNHGSSQIRR